MKPFSVTKLLLTKWHPNEGKICGETLTFHVAYKLSQFLWTAVMVTCNHYRKNPFLSKILWIKGFCWMLHLNEANFGHKTFLDKLVQELMTRRGLDLFNSVCNENLFVNPCLKRNHTKGKCTSWLVVMILQDFWTKDL